MRCGGEAIPHLRGGELGTILDEKYAGACPWFALDRFLAFRDPLFKWDVKPEYEIHSIMHEETFDRGRLFNLINQGVIVGWGGPNLTDDGKLILEVGLKAAERRRESGDREENIL